MTTTKTTYKVKDLIGNWTSLPHNTLEEAQIDMVRLRDRVGMMEWKTRPPHNYVVVKEDVVTTHTLLCGSKRRCSDYTYSIDINAPCREKKIKTDRKHYEN